MFNAGGLRVVLPRAENELVQFKCELARLKPVQQTLNYNLKQTKKNEWQSGRAEQGAEPGTTAGLCPSGGKYSRALAGTQLAFKQPSLRTACIFFISQPKHKPGLALSCL